MGGGSYERTMWRRESEVKRRKRKDEGRQDEKNSGSS